MSMPTITLTPPSKTTLISHPPEISTNTRDASFSSYLDGAEESFVLKLGSKSTPNDRVFLGKSESDDKELDVFAAEKYFNEADNSPKPTKKLPPTHHHPKKDELALEILAIKPHPAKTTTTPSIRSESSSNSRSALLQTIPRNQQPKKANKKSFFARIGCNCSCADKNSVDVDDDENKTDRFAADYDSVKLNEPEHGKIKPGAHFTFPVFNPKPGEQAEKIKTGRVEEKDVIIAKRSKSLQVFGGPGNGKMCSGLEKKLAMMTWDAIIAPEEIKTIPSISSEMLGGDDDSDGSDASSDLFEIESLSRGGAHTNPFQAASDGCKSPTATTCYAPSEASVEWSVVTASAADFEEIIGSNPIPCPKKIGASKEMPRLRTGILSGCMSQKAIKIGGDGNGFGGGRRNLRTESFTTRFRDENKLDARDRHRSSFDARVLCRQRSDLLYA